MGFKMKGFSPFTQNEEGDRAMYEYLDEQTADTKAERERLMGNTESPLSKLNDKDKNPISKAAKYAKTKGPIIKNKSKYTANTMKEIAADMKSKSDRFDLYSLRKPYDYKQGRRYKMRHHYKNYDPMRGEVTGGSQRYLPSEYQESFKQEEQLAKARKKEIKKLNRKGFRQNFFTRFKKS